MTPVAAGDGEPTGLNGIIQQACGRGIEVVSYAPSSLQQLELGRVLGVPERVLQWIGVTLALAVVLSATAFGRRTRAIADPRAAAARRERASARMAGGVRVSDVGR